MTDSLRFLVAVAGTEDPALPGFVARICGAGDRSVEVTLLHVAETGPRELAARDPGVRRGPWPQPKVDAIERRLAKADDEATAAILGLWSERFAAAMPAAAISHLAVRGRPEQEIVAAAGHPGVEAVVLCARPRPGSIEPGPRGLGHVARYVVDHSPVPVLLFRTAR